MTGKNMKKKYYVTDVELTKGNYSQGDTLSWTYAGKEYSATGEFFVDSKGYLHHSFFTPRGKEIEIKVKYQ